MNSQLTNAATFFINTDVYVPVTVTTMTFSQSGPISAPQEDDKDEEDTGAEVEEEEDDNLYEDDDVPMDGEDDYGDEDQADDEDEVDKLEVISKMSAEDAAWVSVKSPDLKLSS